MPMVDADAVARIMARVRAVDYNNTPVDNEQHIQTLVEEILAEVRNATVTTPTDGASGTIS